MDIYFKSKRLQKICSAQKEAIRRLGQKGAEKLMQRMSELKAAETLNDISYFPPARLHELTGNRKGNFSVDLEHPYRLLFISAVESKPLKEDGGIDKEKVTAIEIIEIKDTH